MLTDLKVKFAKQFYLTFIKDKMYKLFLEGAYNTFITASTSIVIGILIGLITAVIKDWSFKYKKKFIHFLLNSYVAATRGTPLVVQLLISYYVIFVKIDHPIFIAILCMSMNSGAYVSEIIRSGISSIDIGQVESAKAMGLGYGVTVKNIILPQALRNSAPSLMNEFISLVKETSILGYVAIIDFTRAGNLVRSKTNEPYFSLMFVAAGYFLITLLMTKTLKKIEIKLNNKIL